MMRVYVIALGKLKESYLRDACAEYLKRLQGFCQMHLVELPACKLPDAPSEAQIYAALEKEADSIEKQIPSGAQVAALCIEGESMSSERFSTVLQQSAYTGSGCIAFVIGSSYGLSPRIKRRADICLSMSEMTFPHQMARVMLLEQIYRGFQILSGGKYHK